MLPSLDDTGRRRMMRISAVACASACLLAPLAGRSSGGPNGASGGAEVRLRPPLLPAEATPAPVEVTRDPFEVGAFRKIESNDAAGISPLTLTLPPNAGAAGVPFGGLPVFGAPTLRAIVTGASARALIEDAGTVRVVAVGDALAGSQIVSIGAGGVRLRSGVVYRLKALVGGPHER